MLEIRRAEFAKIREYDCEFSTEHETLRKIICECEKNGEIKKDQCLRFEITETLLCECNNEQEVLVGEKNPDVRISPVLLVEICLVSKSSLFVMRRMAFILVIKDDIASISFDRLNSDGSKNPPLKPIEPKEISKHIITCSN